MEATLTNNNIASSNVQSIAITNEAQVIKKKSDSLEFLSGMFYIFKKVFLLG